MTPVHHQALGDQGHHQLMTEWPITLFKISWV